MSGEYVGRYELRAHFDTCKRCRDADLSTSRGLADLCIEGSRLVKGYAEHARGGALKSITRLKAGA
jgi:hypothetical protein